MQGQQALGPLPPGRAGVTVRPSGALTADASISLATFLRKPVLAARGLNAVAFQTLGSRPSAGADAVPRSRPKIILWFRVSA